MDHFRPWARSAISAAVLAIPCSAALADTGSIDSLADVAQYYYVTDLRPKDTDVLPSPPSAGPEDDRAAHHHMVTYVVGLGVSGTIAYDPLYRSSTTGDFSLIRSGALSWPIWPTPEVEASSDVGLYSKPQSIDDFWHAAVNGRGEFFSAKNSYSMIVSLQAALSGIDKSFGAGGGATVTTSTPTSGDSNAVFVPGFQQVSWTGDLVGMTLDPTSASLGIDTTLGTALAAPLWSAKKILQSMVSATADDRKIYLRSVNGSNNLTPFLWGNLTSPQKTYFDSTDVALWSHYPSMGAGQRTAAAGNNLVNYLRGQTGFEGFVPNDLTLLYRKRDSVLGDIVDSQPVYVKGPSFGYLDSGYLGFKDPTTAPGNRKKMVYVGANDGMLHAFYAPTATDTNWADRGKEAWAYIPGQVLPKLYSLADVRYDVNHQFLVDGTPTVGDVHDASGWSTILVGGLNAGGNGYYALDITDPDAPKSLWEFALAQDANMGLSFGRPIISKLNDANKTWVVIFTSGYNNADGHGYLYVVDAKSGALLRKISTNVGITTTDSGTVASPSGLREINNWVNNATVDNTTQRVYGGDLLGNVWRFDVNSSPGTAVKLAVLKSADTTPVVQPVTARLELAEIGGYPYIFVGTGQLLGAPDVVAANFSTQSVYSFKDMVYPGFDVRPTLKLITVTAVTGNSTRTVGVKETVCSNKTGWVMDLPEPGERMNVDFKAAKGTLAFVTNVPSSDGSCSSGHSWLNYVDMVSGCQVSGSDKSGDVLDTASLAVGLGIVDAGSSGSSKLKAFGLSALAQVKVKDIPWSTPIPVGKRVSWRELFN